MKEKEKRQKRKEISSESFFCLLFRLTSIVLHDMLQTRLLFILLRLFQSEFKHISILIEKIPLLWPFSGCQHMSDGMNKRTIMTQLAHLKLKTGSLRKRHTRQTKFSPLWPARSVIELTTNCIECLVSEFPTRKIRRLGEASNMWDFPFFSGRMWKDVKFYYSKNIWRR